MADNKNWKDINLPRIWDTKWEPEIPYQEDSGVSVKIPWEGDTEGSDDD